MPYAARLTLGSDDFRLAELKNVCATKMERPISSSGRPALAGPPQGSASCPEHQEPAWRALQAHLTEATQYPAGFDQMWRALRYLSNPGVLLFVVFVFGIFGLYLDLTPAILHGAIDVQYDAEKLIVHEFIGEPEHNLVLESLIDLVYGSVLWPHTALWAEKAATPGAVFV
jgi:hypothetical protein